MRSPTKLHCKFLQCCFITSAMLISLPLMVRAETAAILKVSAETAQGTTQGGQQRIVLGLQGVNLSFLSTNETIQKVWLDNPSRVVIDFDGCLSASGQSGSGNSCNGASIVRLRQLPERIDFPKGFFTDSQTSQLTVVTTGSSNRKIYQFLLVLSGGMPPHSTVEIIPSPPPTPAQLTSISQEYQQTALRQLSKGLAIAESKQMVDKQSPAYQQVVATIALMQGGKPFADAMKQTGVPNVLIDRLRSLGSAP